MPINSTTVVILAIIVMVAIAAAAVLAGRSARRRPILKPLSPESHDRYVTRWDAIEARFVDSPDDAVREADALMLAILGERGHPLAEDRLPAAMRKARRLGSGREGRGGTEGMRRAMLQYRAVIEEYARPIPEPDRLRDNRPEIASQ